jgi:hypothetical protein
MIAATNYDKPIKKFYVKCTQCHIDVEACEPYYTLTGYPVIYEIINDICSTTKFGILNSTQQFLLFLPNSLSIADYIRQMDTLQSGQPITVKYSITGDLLDIIPATSLTTATTLTTAALTTTTAPTAVTTADTVPLIIEQKASYLEWLDD